MKENKLRSYLGFAIKSGKTLFGYDKLFEKRVIPKLVIICSTLNEKNSSKVIDFCSNLGVKYIKLDSYVLGELIQRDNCKVIGICDDNFSKVICQEIDLLNGNQ